MSGTPCAARPSGACLDGVTLARQKIHEHLDRTAVERDQLADECEADAKTCLSSLQRDIPCMNMSKILDNSSATSIRLNDLDVAGCHFGAVCTSTTVIEVCGCRSSFRRLSCLDPGAG